MSKLSTFTDRTMTSANVTVVYESLDPSLLNMESLRKLTGGSLASLQQFETVVGTVPAHQASFEFGSRRMSVTSHKSSIRAEDIPVWELATSLHGLIPPDKSRIQAFGFNYDLRLTARNNADIGHVAVQHFGGDTRALKSKLDGGEPLAMGVGYIYTRGNNLHQLRIEPANPQSIVIHLNIHVVSATLPGADEMRTLFIDGFSHLSKVIDSLFEGLPA